MGYSAEVPRIRVKGFTIRVYSDDHQPAHVHIFRGGAEIRVYLRGNREHESLAGHMGDADVRRALRIVDERHQELLALWKKYHE